MLRNRSRAVTTKQSLMADHNISSFFLSPRFRVFTSKISPFESDYAQISPTSILDSKPTISPFKNTKPFCCHESTNPKSPRFHSPEKPGIGLADLVNSVISDDWVRQRVLFGSKLRVQIPPADFATKTKDLRYPGQGYSNQGVQADGCISVREMELCEDYTCVISHGSNPKTTHIFDSCVVMESYCSLPDMPDKAKNHDSAKMDNFLSFCYTCKKNLDQRHDIYIYRGEKAFCSRDCRYQEMLIDEIES